jgi:hypothetical protein
MPNTQTTNKTSFSFSASDMFHVEHHTPRPSMWINKDKAIEFAGCDLDFQNAIWFESWQAVDYKDYVLTEDGENIVCIYWPQGRGCWELRPAV